MNKLVKLIISIVFIVEIYLAILVKQSITIRIELYIFPFCLLGGRPVMKSIMISFYGDVGWRKACISPYGRCLGTLTC